MANTGLSEDANGAQWLRVFVPIENGLVDGEYRLYGKLIAGTVEKMVAADKNGISNGRLEVRFDKDGRLEGICLDGVRYADAGSLTPYLRYEGRVIGFEPEKMWAEIAPDGMSGAVRVVGKTQATKKNGTVSDGHFDYTFTLPPDCPYLFLDGEIRYPATKLKDTVKENIPALARHADTGWIETSPAEIRFSHRTMKNDPVRGRANPFGAYRDEQYRPPTEGDGQGFEAAIPAGEQCASSALAYNGVSHRICIMVAFFDGDRIPEKLERELVAYANPPVAVALGENESDLRLAGYFFPPAEFTPGVSSNAILFSPTMVSGNADTYFAKAGESGQIERSIPLGLNLRVFWESMIANF